MRTTGLSSVMDLMLQGSLASAQRTMRQAIERLSTGKRINRTSDDVAGFMVADQLKLDRARLEKQINGAEQHNHMLAAKDGALSVINDLVIELQGIVVQAGNRGALGDEELDALQERATSILNTFDFLAGTSKYKDEFLLKGFDSRGLGLRRASDYVAPNPDVEGEVEPEKPTQFVDLIDGDLEAIQDAVDAAAKHITLTRAGAGNLMRENESNIGLWMNELESTVGELSRIEDTDFAAEVSRLVRAQVLQEVSLRSMMIDREQARRVLSLLN